MKYGRLLIIVAGAALLFLSCAKVPAKKFFTLNYEPDALVSRLSSKPWPCVIRIKEFAIEPAYARAQVVYRKSPYEFEYYFYKVWAVKPNLMLTDIIRRHLNAVGLVRQVVLRFDESERPAFELQGTVEAIEEYDSDNVWFAHLDFSVRLVRLADGKVMYTKEFDSRRQVQLREAEAVIMTLSQLADISISQLAADIDVVMAQEYGSVSGAAQ